MGNLGSLLVGLGNPCRWIVSLPYLPLTAPNDHTGGLEEFHVFPEAIHVIKGSGPGPRVSENVSSSEA
jgi:hypothetical protein